MPRVAQAALPLPFGAAACTGQACGERTEAFLDEVRGFRAFGAPTQETVENGIRYLVNEFWTAGQRRGHVLHEISYRACFKPQLPEFFIARLTAPGDAVLDPFMGRGTTPIQAALMGRKPVGSDINPLSVCLTRPRLAPPEPPAVAETLRRVSWDEPGDMPLDLLAFYHPDTLRQICALRSWLIREAPPGQPWPDPAVDWVRMVALNRLTGHSPGFFSVYTLPPNQAASVASQLRINAKRGQVPPPRDVAALILRKSAQLLRQGAPPPHPAANLATCAADDLRHVPTASVSLVVTSPPFLDVVQYAQDNALRAWFAGLTADEFHIPVNATPESWQAAMRAVLAELTRVLRPGGYVAFEVGEVRGGTLMLERLIWQAAEDLPLARLAVMVNAQSFTKTANCWGIANNRSGTNTNRIVLLRRN